jgi:hypothetical protein
MTNTVAAWLAALIVAGALADASLNDGETLAFLATRLLRTIEWMAFWR